MPELQSPTFLLVVALGSLLLAWTFVRVVREAAVRQAWTAGVRHDRWHSIATPHYGGIAIAGAILVAIALVRGASDSFRDAGSANSELMTAIIVGTIAAAITGLLDDIIAFGPATKLAAQCGCACAFLWLAGGIELTGSAPVDSVIELLWIVGMMNAINMFDNMDGVAGTVLTIGFATIGVACWMLAPSSPVTVLAVVGAGCTAGFLGHNLPRAKIFMGDSGSLSLGFLLAVLGLVCVRPLEAGDGEASSLTSQSTAVATAVIGIGAVLVPLADMIVVSLARIRRGQSPMQGGRDHSTHRLASLGWSGGGVVACAGVAAAAGGAVVMLSAARLIEWTTGLVLVVTAGVMMVVGLLRVAISMDKAADVRNANGIQKRAALAPFIKVIVDVALVAVALNLGYLLRWEMTIPPELTNSVGWSLPVAMASCVTVHAIGRDYWRSWSDHGWQELRQSLVLALCGAGVAVVLIAALWSPQRLFSRVAMAYFLVLYPIGSVVLRQIIGWVLRG